MNIFLLYNHLKKKKKNDYTIETKIYPNFQYRYL